MLSKHNPKNKENKNMPLACKFVFVCCLLMNWCPIWGEFSRFAPIIALIGSGPTPTLSKIK